METLKNGMYVPKLNEFFENYPGHDKYDMPDKIIRVTAGPGGEAFLILGSEKTALYDCGMCCFAGRIIHNIDHVLSGKGRTLDYIIISHTHYDHIGALPYIIKRWPGVKVCGSPKAARVFESEGARSTMEELGKKAADLYGINEVDITARGMRLDIALKDGDSISLGNEQIYAYETKGHTDCSMSYYLADDKVLFVSESTGVHAGPDFLYTAILKSFDQCMESAAKLEKLEVKYYMCPHYGCLPQPLCPDYFARCRQAALRERSLILAGLEKGKSQEEILDEHKKIYWTEKRNKNQPYSAYRLNAEIAVKLFTEEWKNNKKNK